MRPGVSFGVLGYPGVSWGNQTDPRLGISYTCTALRYTPAFIVT